MCRLSRFCLLLPWLLLAGCNHTPAVSGTDEPRIHYDDSIYCFNGRSIVSLNGLWGLVDIKGTYILEPEWDAIEFLSDDVALLRRTGLYYLCTRDGRVFAENTDPDILESSYQTFLTEMEYADRQRWDKVLDRLESLCDACIAGTARRPDSRILQEKAALESELTGISGQMSKQQDERLKQIVDKFNAYYR